MPQTRAQRYRRIVTTRGGSLRPALVLSLSERCPSGLRSATGNRVRGESCVAGSNPALSVRRGGTHGSPTNPLLRRCSRTNERWPPGRQSRPPAATLRSSTTEVAPRACAARSCSNVAPRGRGRSLAPLPDAAYDLPATDETYAATSWICCSVSCPLKDGIGPAPFVTRSTTRVAGGFASSRFGPTVPVAPASASV